MSSFNRVLIKSPHGRILIYWALVLIAIVFLRSERVEPNHRIVRGEAIAHTEIVRFAPSESTVIEDGTNQQNIVLKHSLPQDQEKVSDCSVDVNSATIAELQTLRGIGPVLAQRIWDYRMQNGTFRSVAELKNVKGIGEITVQKLLLQSVIASR